MKGHPDGYHHLRIREGDEHYRAFITEYGLYEWTVACFGLRNAPAEFARFMSSNLREFLNEFVVVYFDDIIIYSDELESHWEQVKRVLQRLREKEINLKIKKCEFGVLKNKEFNWGAEEEEAFSKSQGWISRRADTNLA